MKNGHDSNVRKKNRGPSCTNSDKAQVDAGNITVHHEQLQPVQTIGISSEQQEDAVFHHDNLRPHIFNDSAKIERS